MKNTILSTLCVVSGFCFQSCGSAEQAGNEILRVGGISSTGNKDEGNDESPRANKNEGSPGQAPDTQSFVCDAPVDLGGADYTPVSPESGASCSGTVFEFACAAKLSFANAQDLTIQYRMNETGENRVVPATYRMCGSELSVWFVKQDGSLKHESFESSSDRTILRHASSGLEMKFSAKE